MINLNSYRSKAVALLGLSHTLVSLFSMSTLWLILHSTYFNDDPIILITLGLIVIVISLLASSLTVRILEGPLKLIVQALLYIADDNLSPPSPDKIPIAKDFTKSLLSEIYSLASEKKLDRSQSLDIERKIVDNVLSGLPLPLVILDSEQKIQYLNPHARELVYKKGYNPIEKPISDAIRMTFRPGVKDALSWLEGVKEEKIQSYEVWRNVSIISEEVERHVDLVVFYNASEAHGLETILAFVDRTEEYGDQEDEISFIALAVHELRTPITLIRGYVEVLEKELSGKVDKEYSDFIHKLHLAAERLAVFTNNVLNVAKVESKQINLKRKLTSPGEIVSLAVKDRMLWANIEKRNIETTIEEKLPEINVDGISIQEVIGNLLDNSIKYSSSGTTIRVSASKENNDIVIQVSDQGVGIPSNVLKNIFTRFYRSHRTKGTIGGSGLGLYLAKSIIEAHRGHIEIRSNEGEGTNVTIKLPIDIDSSSNEKDNDSRGWIKNHNLQRR